MLPSSTLTQTNKHPNTPTHHLIPHSHPVDTMGAAASKDPAAVIAQAKVPAAYNPPLGAPNPVRIYAGHLSPMS